MQKQEEGGSAARGGGGGGGDFGTVGTLTGGSAGAGASAGAPPARRSTPTMRAPTIRRPASGRAAEGAPAAAVAADATDAADADAENAAPAGAADNFRKARTGDGIGNAPLRGADVGGSTGSRVLANGLLAKPRALLRVEGGRNSPLLSSSTSSLSSPPVRAASEMLDMLLVPTPPRDDAARPVSVSRRVPIRPIALVSPSVD